MIKEATAVDRERIARDDFAAQVRREDEALERAWNKIDSKIHATPGGKQTELVVKFTLLELKMLRQFQRKHGGRVYTLDELEIERARRRGQVQNAVD